MTSSDIANQLRQAKEVNALLASSSLASRNEALSHIKHALANNAPRIFEANTRDVELAIKNNLAPPLVKRLKFDQEKLSEVLKGIEAIINQDEPLNIILRATELDKELDLYRVSCPLGLIAMIFESRPDALIQMSALSLKSGNCIVAKGGSEALNTNSVLAEIIHEAALKALPIRGWLVHATNREQISELLAYHDLVDLVIPRGSNEFVQYIMAHSKIPVMGHADGICHAYVEKSADLDLATRVIVDAKTQYVAVCNAVETILVDEALAKSYIPQLAKTLRDKDVIIYGCPKTQAIIDCEPVETFAMEYLDYKVSMKVVSGLNEAMAHIAKYGSKHTELILTTDKASAREFMQKVDAASVVLNASTRFADGFRYGLGAEVGIATGKLHARGPVGLEGLITYKYKLFGNGHIVADYSGAGAKSYTHKTIQSPKDPFDA